MPDPMTLALAESLTEDELDERYADDPRLTMLVGWRAIAPESQAAPARLLARMDATRGTTPVDGRGRERRSLVLADREAELLEVKGRCTDPECRLHFAHRGPHDVRDPAASVENESQRRVRLGIGDGLDHAVAGDGGRRRTVDMRDPDGSEDSWSDTLADLVESAFGLICNVDGPAQGWTQNEEWVRAADRWCARYDRVIGAASSRVAEGVERLLVGELSAAFEAGRNWVPGGAAWDTQQHARRIAARLAIAPEGESPGTSAVAAKVVEFAGGPLHDAERRVPITSGALPAAVVAPDADGRLTIYVLAYDDGEQPFYDYAGEPQGNEITRTARVLDDRWPAPASPAATPPGSEHAAGAPAAAQLSEPLDVNGACDRRPTVDGKPACCGGQHRLMCARGRIGVTDGADLAQLQALEQKLTTSADLSEHAATLRWARIVVAADAKAASHDPSAAHELRTLLLRIGRAEQAVRQHRCVAGDRAALVPSIEAMLFAPLTEERTATLDEALRPLVHQRLTEWAAAVKATDLANRLSRAAVVDDLAAKVSSGVLSVGQAWDRLHPDDPTPAASGDELTLTGDTLGRTTIPAGDPAGPPTLRDLVDPGDAHRAVVATFTKHAVAIDGQAIAWWAARAVLDLQTNHRCTSPPLITGPEAADYPVGTRLVSSDGEGRPRLPAGVFEVDRHTNRMTFAREVRFLAFPPPPKSPEPVVHRFPPDWSSGEPFALACCGRAPAEVGQRDQMALDDDHVTCPGPSTPAEESGPDPARAASTTATAPSSSGASS